MSHATAARVLVVEDDPRVQEVLELQLQDLGFHVMQASDGQEGLQRVQDASLHLDVIVLDLNLPLMHGIEVLEHVARLRPLVPVLVLTGYSNVEMAADVMRRGAFYYLTKPVNRHRLEAELQRALDHRALLLDRERLAAENRRYQQGLERMVEQKSAELLQAHQRLLDVQSSLARADKADTLEIALTSVVHEVRNPLSVITASVELARLRGADPDTAESLDSVWMAARQIDGILLRTRGLGPARVAQWERVVLAEVLDTAIALTRAHFVRAGVHARVRNEGPECIIADRGRMLQVLLNLILNACQAMKAGGDLELRATPADDPDFIRLEVRDTGPGIPPDLLDQVLRPFVTTRGSEGTGLGLSIAREICENHGGFLLLDSEVGQGTTATMLLPLQPELGVSRTDPG